MKHTSSQTQDSSSDLILFWSDPFNAKSRADCSETPVSLLCRGSGISRVVGPNNPRSGLHFSFDKVLTQQGNIRLNLWRSKPADTECSLVPFLLFLCTYKRHPRKRTTTKTSFRKGRHAVRSPFFIGSVCLRGAGTQHEKKRFSDLDQEPAMHDRIQDG